MIKMLDTFTIGHIAREENVRANDLAQQASGYRVDRGKFLLFERPMLAVDRKQSTEQSMSQSAAGSVLGVVQLDQQGKCDGKLVRNRTVAVNELVDSSASGSSRAGPESQIAEPVDIPEQSDWRSSI